MITQPNTFTMTPEERVNHYRTLIAALLRTAWQEGVLVEVETVSMQPLRMRNVGLLVTARPAPTDFVAVFQGTDQ